MCLNQPDRATPLRLEHPDVAAAEALERAAEFREAADEARSRAQWFPVGRKMIDRHERPT